MLKLLKYELKGNYKFFLLMFLTALILSLSFIYFECIGITGRGETSINIIVVFITLISVIKSWINEMYGTYGYLTFTLPQKGRNVLGAKFISAVIWFMLCFLLEVITHFLRRDYSFLVSLYNNIYILSIGISIMFMGYFCVVVTRVDNSDKKLGKLIGVITFILLIVFICIADISVLTEFSSSINLPFSDGSIYQGDIMLICIEGNANIRVNASGLHLNIATLIFNILFLVGLFEATVYIIDNKIDL